MEAGDVVWDVVALVVAEVVGDVVAEDDTLAVAVVVALVVCVVQSQCSKVPASSELMMRFRASAKRSITPASDDLT